MFTGLLWALQESVSVSNSHKLWKRRNIRFKRIHLLSARSLFPGPRNVCDSLPRAAWNCTLSFGSGACTGVATILCSSFAFRCLWRSAWHNGRPLWSHTSFFTWLWRTRSAPCTLDYLFARRGRGSTAHGDGDSSTSSPACGRRSAVCLLLCFHTGFTRIVDLTWENATEKETETKETREGEERKLNNKNNSSNNDIIIYIMSLIQEKTNEMDFRKTEQKLRTKNTPLQSGMGWLTYWDHICHPWDAPSIPEKKRDRWRRGERVHIYVYAYMYIREYGERDDMLLSDQYHPPLRCPSRWSGTRDTVHSRPSGPGRRPWSCAPQDQRRVWAVCISGTPARGQTSTKISNDPRLEGALDLFQDKHKKNAIYIYKYSFLLPWNL